MEFSDVSVTNTGTTSPTSPPPSLSPISSLSSPPSSNISNGSGSSGSSVNAATYAAPLILSPCAACKILRRRCAEKCVLAPYFPPTEPTKFAIAHRVFGASKLIPKSLPFQIDKTCPLPILSQPKNLPPPKLRLYQFATCPSLPPLN